MRIVDCDDHALLLEAMEIALPNLGHEVVAVRADGTRRQPQFPGWASSAVGSSGAGNSAWC